MALMCALPADHQTATTLYAVLTGAELISSVCDDENKTFGVVFRTPVDNSYGIPHILEHSVLCGSRKYPIRVRSVSALG